MVGFWIFIGLLAVGSLAFWHKMKIWSLTLIGFKLLFATLLTIGTYEVAATAFDNAAPVMSYYTDMICFMAIFIVTHTILMILTARFSKVDVYFEQKTENIGKWAISICVILGFSTSAGYVMYRLMPDKPNNQNTPVAAIVLVDLLSKGSLSPMIGPGTTFETKNFVQRQYIRNSGVYVETVDNGTWKFPNESSPNVQ